MAAFRLPSTVSDLSYAHRHCLAFRSTRPTAPARAPRQPCWCSAPASCIPRWRLSGCLPPFPICLTRIDIALLFVALAQLHQRARRDSLVGVLRQLLVFLDGGFQVAFHRFRSVLRASTLPCFS